MTTTDNESPILQYITIGVILLIIGLVNLCSAAKDLSRVYIPVIDANAEIPPKKYLKVDSVDVNPNGVLYDRNWINKQARKPHISTHWAFQVNGRKDVWITIGVATSTTDHISNDVQMEYCAQLLRRGGNFEVADDDHYKETTLGRIKRYRGFDRKKRIILLNYTNNLPTMSK